MTSAVYAMFSGGHDSLASTIVASRMDGFQSVIHLNTGIGIEQTTQYVRDICAMRDWPLIELRPDVTYEELVHKWGGFPKGINGHNSMLWYLKQKPLDRWIRDIPGPTIRLVTGIRKAESSRRMNAEMSKPEHRRGRKLWTAPILNWSKADCMTLIETEGLPRNQVVDLLHRSGECLCGAMARADEIHDIDQWYPEVGQRIHRLERELETLGLIACTWASAEANRLHEQQMPLFSKDALAPLCFSCEATA